MNTPPPRRPARPSLEERRLLARRAKRFLALCLVLALGFLLLAGLGVVVLF